MRISVWIKIFKMVRFEIKIIFCEDKKKFEMTFYYSWMTVYYNWINILNVLKWECIRTRISVSENDQK